MRGEGGGGGFPCERQITISAAAVAAAARSRIVVVAVYRRILPRTQVQQVVADSPEAVLEECCLVQEHVAGVEVVHTRETSHTVALVARRGEEMEESIDVPSRIRTLTAQVREHGWI